MQIVDEFGTVVNADSGEAARLVVFKQDTFEFNDDRFTATAIGTPLWPLPPTGGTYGTEEGVLSI